MPIINRFYQKKIKSRESENISSILSSKVFSIFLPHYSEIQSTFEKRPLLVEVSRLKTKIRLLILFFITALIISGGTAFFIETGLSWCVAALDGVKGALPEWLRTTYNATRNVNQAYPFMAYGYDWLAFAHLVIAVAFIGPLKDPVKNIWIIQFGMIACCMIFPLAFIAGYFREVPLFWRGIDCLFGVVGLIPLAICYYKITLLEKLGNDHVIGKARSFNRA